jgi:dTDP-4-dehydrorhamnose 3,5-epimerase
MNFIELGLKGAYLIEIEPIHDERGFFARNWNRSEFRARGLETELEESSLSFNVRRGTLRGLHYQVAPFEEIKLVRCTQGAIFDVVVDLRRGSDTYLRWDAVELTADNRCLRYIPKGMAHGFQTLVDGTEVFYQMSAVYSPQHSRGIRWDDPALGIPWPETETRTLSAADHGRPLLGNSP